MRNTDKKTAEPKIGRTILDDIRNSDFRRGLRRDFKELKEFFLNDERKKQLFRMGRFKRWFLTTWWLLKGLFFNLTPVRRLLFVLAVILMLASRQLLVLGEVEVNTNLSAFGSLLLIFIIMLELKDKLLAKSELSEGRSIQNALMPDRNPEISGWDVWMYSRPANDVGGDLVDYLPLGSNRFGISLADVSGKGLGAALFMAKLQATIRALAPDFTSLGEFTDKLNNIFYRDSIANRFASLFYLEISSDGNDIKYVNAGHFPPIIFREDEMIELSKGETALGLSPNSVYKEKIIKLGKNDLFFVYSDGLTEAMNEAGNFFTDERLKNLLKQLEQYPAGSIGESILDQVNQFIGDALPADDLSMVIIKKKS